MPSEIILLTGDAEAPHLESILYRHNPGLKTIHARDRRELLDSCPADGTNARRLIAFCTTVIVPEEVLNAVMPPAYNFHPGPPTYPGSHVASFAVGHVPAGAAERIAEVHLAAGDAARRRLAVPHQPFGHSPRRRLVSAAVPARLVGARDVPAAIERVPYGEVDAKTRRA